MTMVSNAAANASAASGSSFYSAMRILPPKRRRAIMAIYSFCRAVDDIADEPALSREDRLKALDSWRADLKSLYSGGSPGLALPLTEAVAEFHLDLADFFAVVDGMEMDVRATIQAPSAEELDLYCDRVASAVGRLCVRVFGLEQDIGARLAHHLGRALQLTNILRDLDEDAMIGRLYLPRNKLEAFGIEDRTPAGVLADFRLNKVCMSVAEDAGQHFRHAIDVMNSCPRSVVRAPRIMAEVYRAILERLIARGWKSASPTRAHAEIAGSAFRAPSRDFMMSLGRVHIVGAGLAGLAAAVALRDKAEVIVHEAGPQAGGRCRSFYDEALGANIDNGNHLVLSGNRATLAFAKTIGAKGLEGPRKAEFSFADFKSGERWTIRPNRSVVPWWVFASSRRAPGTRAANYFAMVKLAGVGKNALLSECIECSGPFYERFLQPVLVAALNTDPAVSAASLARAVAMGSLARGAGACRPLIARSGLSSVFVDPAIALLNKSDATIRFNHRLRKLVLAENKVGAIEFNDELILLRPRDRLILAAPAPVAADLVPELRAPTHFNAIVNAHFMVDAPPGFPPMLGVVNATTEWIFSFPGRVSVTISDANRLLETPRSELAAKIWSEVSSVTGLPANLPPCRIIKEKRATFAATPAENARRPPTRTRWRNLFLAGDWTATGLPATIEGAVRSGNRAAKLALATG